MIKLAIGFVLGFAVATVGFSGIATILDRGAAESKTILEETANQKK